MLLGQKALIGNRSWTTTTSFRGWKEAEELEEMVGCKLISRFKVSPYEKSLM